MQNQSGNMFVKTPIKDSFVPPTPEFAGNMTEFAGNMANKSHSSETDSVGESDASTTVSVRGGTPSQRVFRWSKFVRNLYEMAVNSANAKAVGFSHDGQCLEVRDSKLLSSEVLQKYFKHKNVSSFIRQLNNYGFKTVPIVMNSMVSHCFAHDCFQKDRLDLLEGVTRRNAGSDAQKIGERIVALREKESEFEQRMVQLKRVNDDLRRQNYDLQEENKRLKSNWAAMQDTLKSRMYEQHHHSHMTMSQQQPQQRRTVMPSQVPDPINGFVMDPNSHEMFPLPVFPSLFPEEF